MPFHAEGGFFKILVHRNFQEELMIPNSFVKEHWKRLSNPILLRLPTGVEQKVHWTKRDDNIWLENGWEKFVELCHLKYEYLLVFKYKGGSCFKVRVFDKSASQIDYSSLRCNEETNKDCEVGNDDCIEIVDDESEGPQQLCKRKKTNTGAARRSLLRVRTNLKTGPTKKPLEDSQCIKALERAEAFSSKLKNPSFIRDMKPSYVQYDFMHIPSWYSKQYLNGLQGRATIGVCGDMTRTVKYSFCNSTDRTTIKSGWKSFCQKYELEAGDVCVFERTEVTPLSFKINIIRAREEPSSHQLHLQESESQNMQANQFEIHIKEYHLKRTTNVYIPKEFINKHDRCLGKNVLLQVGKMSWTVKVLGRGVFCKGWPAFAKGCELDAGDLCLFKMIDNENFVFEIDNENFVFDVSISREHN